MSRSFVLQEKKKNILLVSLLPRVGYIRQRSHGTHRIPSLLFLFACHPSLKSCVKADQSRARNYVQQQNCTALRSTHSVHHHWVCTSPCWPPVVSSCHTSHRERFWPCRLFLIHHNCGEYNCQQHRRPYLQFPKQIIITVLHLLSFLFFILPLVIFSPPPSSSLLWIYYVRVWTALLLCNCIFCVWKFKRKKERKK